MNNYGYCKKDFKEEMNNKYENYLNDREINKTIQPKQNYNQSTEKIQPKNQEYNKEEFLDEIMRIHNDIYFNPYKILEIDKNYTPETLKQKYKEMALQYHPDKGGDAEVFQDITKAYIYLLKKYKENMPDKQIFELKDDFNDFTHDQSKNKNKNILMQDKNFNINQFNNIFDENFQTKSKGYGDFLKNGEETKKTENNSYIFSDKFNLSIFNKIFNTTTKKVKKDTVTVYKEPETIFQSNNGFSEIGQNDEELEDYTSGFTFDKKIHYTDCKRAYTNPEDMSNIDLESFNSLNELEKHRENISYKMNNQDQNNYDNYLELEKIKELQRIKKIERNDLNILKKYKKFNNIMLEN